jgi:hypothetical protein
MDSIWVVPLPWIGSVQIPVTSFWNSLGQLLSGSIIALLVWRLAKNRIRTERWHERQADAYHSIVEHLYVMQEYTGEKGADDDRRLDMQPPRRLESEYEAMWPAVLAAQRAVERHAAVGPFLLTPQAVAILQRYCREKERLDDADLHHYTFAWHYVVRRCWIEFSDRARRDLGQLGDVRYWWRRGRRSIARLLVRVGSQRRELVLGARTAYENWQLTRGPQLTQADVRFPPRYRHWKTVEEMNAWSWPRHRIQRHLRQQLAGDPPPWT